MKPFRATYQRRSTCRDIQVDPEEVLVIEILRSHSEDRDPEVVFVHSDGRLDSDWLDRFYNGRISWPES